jgi:hypothetical protein
MERSHPPFKVTIKVTSVHAYYSNYSVTLNTGRSIGGLTLLWKAGTY